MCKVEQGGLSTPPNLQPATAQTNCRGQRSTRSASECFETAPYCRPCAQAGLVGLVQRPWTSVAAPPELLRTRLLSLQVTETQSVTGLHAGARSRCRRPRTAGSRGPQV